MKTIYVVLIFIIGLIACKTSNKSISNDQSDMSSITYNINSKGIPINIEFIKGVSYNHPLFAIWIEDYNGKYIQTLYVSQSIGKGIFNYGDKSTGRWLPGELRRPAALPYWAHKRNIIENDSLYLPTPKTPIPDAYTGATPKNDFILKTKSDSNINKFKVFFELNQSWDWNEFWNNNKYPNDINYKSSSQPSLIYSTELIDLNNLNDLYPMKIIGHGHYAGKDGSLTTDISTLTSALKIADSISVKIIR